VFFLSSDPRVRPGGGWVGGWVGGREGGREGEEVEAANHRNRRALPFSTAGARRREARRTAERRSREGSTEGGREGGGGNAGADAFKAPGVKVSL
jgi:hypothetical protein